MLNLARNWIVNEVLYDAARKRPRDSAIDDWRTGRVLFVDGPRGAGKTSFLLTMLKEWGIDGPSVVAHPDDKWRSRILELHVLFPVLDFDPLPRSMPLHAWLLEPWRLFIKDQLTKSDKCNDQEDLHEQLANLAEKAILGFTSIRTQDAGAVAKALAYRDQASGLLDTQREWRRFVDAVVCRVQGCRNEKCEGGHRQLFVVAIDDVDLQVEHIPSLLHAVRLLWHPNVLYILTGNLEHMDFILELDYAAQHRRVGDMRWPEADSRTGQAIEDYARLLTDALTEKVVARHATIHIRKLRPDEILAYPIEPLPGALETNGSGDRTLGTYLGESWSTVLQQLSKRELCTARRLEYVVDTHVRSSEGHRSPEVVVSRLCEIRPPFSNSARLLPWGRLETRLSESIRELAGDRLQLAIADQPSVIFFPNEGRALCDSDANGALLMRLAVEAKLVPNELTFVWQPVAGFIATRVHWDSGVKDVDGEAIFHWPWLVRPQANQLLVDGQPRVNEIHTAIVKNATVEPSLRSLAQDMPLRWIEINLQWWDEIHASVPSPSDRASHEAPSKGESEAQRTARLAAWKNSIVDRLNRMRRYSEGEKEEVDRWLVELAVLTAPYMGLPSHRDNNVADDIRTMLLRVNKDLRHKLLRENWEARVVKDAIIAAQGQGKDPGSTAFTQAAGEFLKERERRRRDAWWTWRLSGKGTGGD